MNIYNLKPKWDYKIYIPDTSSIKLSKNLFCHFDGHLSMDASSEWVELNMIPLPKTIKASSGDFHKVQLIDEVSCQSANLLSENTVNKIGDILKQYGILFPLTIKDRKEEGKFYFYWVTNEIDCVSWDKSIVKNAEKSNKSYHHIEKLHIDPSKYDGSAIFRVKGDYDSKIFVTEELVNTISQFDLRGFLFNFQNKVLFESKEKNKKEYPKAEASGKFIVKGDDGVYGDWLYSIIELDNKKASGLKKALDELIVLTQDMKGFLSYRKIKNSKKIYEVNMYLIRFKLGDILIEEKDFFEMCVKFSSLHKRMLKYVNNVTSEKMYDDNTWQNEMHHRGLYAITPLLFSNDKYVVEFGKLLSKWDMEGETYQSPLIQSAVLKYGLTKYTLQLLAWRLLSDGQHHREDFNAVFYKMGFRDSFDLNMFLNIINEIITTKNIHFNSNLSYALGDFVSYYAEDKNEGEQLCQKIKNYFSQDTLDEFEEECLSISEELTSEKISSMEYDSNIETEWDGDPIEHLTIGEYLTDERRIKICF